MAENQTIKALSENSLITLLSRTVMIGLVPMSGVFLYFSGDWVNSHVTSPIVVLERRVDQNTITNDMQQRQLDGHEIKLSSNAENLGAMRADVKELGGKLDTLSSSLNGLIEVLKDRDGRSRIGGQP